MAIIKAIIEAIIEATIKVIAASKRVYLATINIFTFLNYKVYL